jgi:hypothetical protein
VLQKRRVLKPFPRDKYLNGGSYSPASILPWGNFMESSGNESQHADGLKETFLYVMIIDQYNRSHHTQSVARFFKSRKEAEKFTEEPGKLRYLELIIMSLVREQVSQNGELSPENKKYIYNVVSDAIRNSHFRRNGRINEYLNPYLKEGQHGAKSDCEHLLRLINDDLNSSDPEKKKYNLRINAEYVD